MSAHFYPSVESMHRMRLPSGLVARVWRDRTTEPLALQYDNSDLDALIEQACADDLALIDLLNAQPGVSAVEVIDAGGNGVVAYRHWP